MTEVTPNYYASGRYAIGFDVVGYGFSSMEGDVVAVTARNNNEPLEYINHGVDNALVIEVQILSDNHLVVNGVVHDYNTPRFLGALVSMDRSLVYWENNTSPVP